MEVVASTRWRAVDVSLVDSWFGRLRGQIGGSPRALLFRTPSVHGFWLRHPVWAVSLDRAGTVLAVDVLKRRRMVWVPSTAWVLELPLEVEPPSRGSILTWSHRDGESGTNDRPSHSLRNPDREPG